ncbi:hypothetical protein [Streptomyces sp. MZ04]|uniref:hypothetical protein n=1 Tax=Streptomyces sp. MZ04 TaxID=2559236 RepID=UPI00143287C5|nr:hypothetical protein [Streptomyces sp. MZ04]
MVLGALIFPLLVTLALLGLAACAPEHDLGRYVLPAVRTAAVLTVATTFVVAIWSH